MFFREFWYLSRPKITSPLSFGVLWGHGLSLDAVLSGEVFCSHWSWYARCFCVWSGIGGLWGVDAGCAPPVVAMGGWSRTLAVDIEGPKIVGPCLSVFPHMPLVRETESPAR